MVLLEDAASRASASWASMGFSSKASSKFAALSGALVGSGSEDAAGSLSGWDGSLVGVSVGSAVDELEGAGCSCPSQPDSVIGSSIIATTIKNVTNLVFFIGVFLS